MSTTTPPPASERSPTTSLVRTLLLYLGLVGLPMLGVVGILRVGRTLSPPMSVGGRWELAAAPAADKAFLDLGGSADRQTPTLTVVQSGVRLAMTLGEGGPATATATFDGGRLRAELAPRCGIGSAATACAGQRKLALDATITRAANAPHMAGEIRFVDCPTCGPIAFTAERVAGPKG